jgi:photosystem II stability/assembly factor-like uncharacterized protein
VLYALPDLHDTAHIYKSIDAGDSWSIVGDINGSAFNLTLDPVNPDTLYAGGSLYCYRSLDGGQSWSSYRVNYFSITTIYSIYVDPTQTNIVYAGGNMISGGFKMAVFKSSDGGVTWTSSVLQSAGSDGRAQVVRLHPTTPTTVYAGGYFQVGSESQAVLMRSVNGGGFWERIDTGLTGASILDLVIDPVNPNQLFCVTSEGIFRSTDGGVVWENRREEPAYSLAIDPLDPQNVYAGIMYAVCCSPDGGDTWEQHGSGLTDQYVFALAIDPTSPHLLYAGSQMGINRSESSGYTWRPCNSGLYATSVSHLAIAASTPEMIFASVPGSNILKSIDGGESWTILPRFFGCGVLYTVAVDPINSDLIYAFSGG